MAIFWCDPYIESPSGGVDGTTGSGTLGSYSNPYSIDNLPSTSSTYTNGDEVRLKALPANPWLTDSLPALQANGSVGNHALIFNQAPDQHSFIKYTSIKGDKTYLSWSSTSATSLRASPPIWGGMGPYADVTLPVYKLDPQYYLSNLATPSKSDLLRIDGRVVTITAGWVSETARGGETIVQRVGGAVTNENWFGIGVTSLIVDAPELTISRSMTLSNKNLNIYGRTVEVHDIIERSGTGGSGNAIKIYTGETFKAHSVASAGYLYIYAPYFNTTAAQGINRDIKYITCAYQIRTYNQGGVPAVNLKFKNFSCMYLQCNFTTTFSYYDDFFFYTSSIFGNYKPTEMALDSAVNLATVFEFKGPMGNLAPKLSYNYNDSNYRNYNAAPIKTSGGYLTNGASIDISKGDIYFRDFLLPTGGTLENVTYHGVISGSPTSTTQAQTAFFGKAWGVDRNSGRRLVFSRTGGANGALSQLMMMYNSTEFNNKLVYHIMPQTSSNNPNSVKSYDTVYIDMPTGVSEIALSTTLRLKFTLGGPVSAPVQLRPYLDGNGTHSSWQAAHGSSGTISIPSGGQAGTVIYSNNFSSGSEIYSSNLVSKQQLICILELYQPSHGVAKICIDSIELEVV